MQQNAWEKWLNGLSSQARAAIVKQVTQLPEAEKPIDFATDSANKAWEDHTRGTQAVLDSVVTLPLALPGVETIGARPLVVVDPDGELSSLKMFETVGEMCRYLATIDGQDLQVWLFWGAPMTVTRGRPRYVLTPNQEQAYLVPLPGFSGEVVLDTVELDVQIQEDGYLGDPLWLDMLSKRPETKETDPLAESEDAPKE